MKKLMLLLSVLCFISFVGCRNQETEKKLIGMWAEKYPDGNINPKAVLGITATAISDGGDVIHYQILNSGDENLEIKLTDEKNVEYVWKIYFPTWNSKAMVITTESKKITTFERQ